MINALILGAHLDDSVIALGGTIRKIVDAGGRVDVVCFGHSDEDYADVADKETCVARISAQARQAHEILGSEQLYLFRLSRLRGAGEPGNIPAMYCQYPKYRPDVLFGHYWAEYFQHRAMARLACDSWWQAGWSCSADLGLPWMARALYHFEIIHPLPEPSDIVDISDTFEAKMAAWSCFQSSSDQVELKSRDGEKVRRYYGTTMGSPTEQLETRARYYGSLIGVRYGKL